MQDANTFISMFYVRDHFADTRRVTYCSTAAIYCVTSRVSIIIRPYVKEQVGPIGYHGDPHVVLRQRLVDLQKH